MVKRAWQGVSVPLLGRDKFPEFQPQLWRGDSIISALHLVREKRDLNMEAEKTPKWVHGKRAQCGHTEFEVSFNGGT